MDFGSVAVGLRLSGEGALAVEDAAFSLAGDEFWHCDIGGLIWSYAMLLYGCVVVVLKVVLVVVSSSTFF